MANRVLKVDALALPDHYYLDEHDTCYYAGEYTAGEGHAYSETNQLILNFKKSPDKRGTSQWQYKDQAIQQAARIFRAAIKASAEVTFVPIPPSKIKEDPLYDDRMVRLLQATCENRHTLNDSVRVEQSKARTKTKSVAPFIDIGAVGAGTSRMEVRLEFGGGVVLTVARG